MNAEYYDLNVYGPDDNKLSLSAYEWELSPEGDLQMNSSKYYTITFSYPKDLKEIEFLLDDLAINHYPFTDYDEWRDLDQLITDKTPDAVFDFLDSLPMYDVPLLEQVLNG